MNCRRRAQPCLSAPLQRRRSAMVSPMVGLMIAMLGLPAAWALDPEGIFQHAPAYTVQIRAMVVLPFVEDTAGSSLGAGFVVDAERGWVMTNSHVAASSPSIVLIAFRGEEYEKASKIYVDPYLDLAILQLAKPQRKNLTAAELDCGELPPMGHPVGAFGHPWGLSYTGTRGIISGATSKVSGEMIQTDAPIDEGNSGGPLISLVSGQVLGINTSGIENTNLAVPMKHACRVLELLQAGDDPSPPQLLTIFFEELDERGKLVVAETYLEPGTIALESGDAIVGVEGVAQEIRNEGQLVHALRGRLDHAVLAVLRDGQRITLAGRFSPADRVTERQGVYASGLLFAPADFRDNQELNLEQPLLVHHVEDGTLAQGLEIETFDVLVKLDGQPVRGLDDLHARLDAAKAQDEPVTLVLKRWSTKPDRVWDYIERTLAVEDLELVGEPDERAAKRN